MTVNYNPNVPGAGVNRDVATAGATTEVQRWTDYRDTIGDVDARVNARAKIVNTDGNPGKTIYVGAVDPAGSYTLLVGDVWIQP